MHDGGKLVHILVVAIGLYLGLGEQCPGNVTSISDGSCDEENNNADCSYDGGDCCQCTCRDTLYACGYHGFECRDPTSPSVFSDCEGAPVVPAPCPTNVTLEVEVWDTSSAEEMAEAVSCSGGAFDVIWRGHVEVDEGIQISNGTILNITGAGWGATMDGRGSTRLFTVEGATLLLYNMTVTNGSAEAGGAIAAVGSTLYLHQTSFVSNTAVGDGGAIYVSHSTMVLTGPTSFIGNTAGSRGGALHVEKGSNVSWPGNTPNAGTTVGWSEEILNTNWRPRAHLKGETVFYGNQALSGGAVFVTETSVVSWDATVSVFDNRAKSSGGAIFVSSGSGVSWFANASFIENKADGDGGGIYMTHGHRHIGSPLLLVNGSTMFLGNQCNGSGGGIAIVGESIMRLEAWDILFEGNSAGAAGGAVFISGLSTGPLFRAARFLSNSADIGGAACLISSGNKASSDGGAIYSLMGSCIIYRTMFVMNVAASGGAVYLASMGYLRDCIFWENASGEEGGYAVYSTEAFAPNFSGKIFMTNVPMCDRGRYRAWSYAWSSIWNDTEHPGDCKGCSAGCRDCVFPLGTALCKPQPDHTVSSPGGDVTSEDLLVEPGYWRENTFDDEVSRCYNPEACLGGRTGAPGYCQEGYEGTLCSVCTDGYMGTSDFRCVKCSGKSTGTVVTAVGGILAAIALSMLTFAMISGKEFSHNPGGRLPGITATWSRPLQSLKIIIVAWQILTQFTDAADVVYPGIYVDLIRGIEVFNFDLSWILSTGCVVDLGFGVRLIVCTAGPIAFMGLLATTFVVGRRKHRGSESALAIIFRNHLSVVIFSTLVMCSPISSILFQTFVKDTLGNGACVLRADTRIRCYDAEFTTLRFWATFMIFQYTLGIPMFYAFLLWVNRKVLVDKAAREDDLLAKSTSALWEAYRPECYYFELIECLRRVFFAAILTFVYPNSVSQVTTALMVGFFFMIVCEVLAPYASRLDAWVSRMGHAVLCTSMFWGILLKFDDLYESLELEEMNGRTLFTCILLASHGFMVVVVLTETVMVTYQLMKTETVEASSTPRRLELEAGR